MSGLRQKGAATRPAGGSLPQQNAATPGSDLMPMESAGRALRGMAAELVEDMSQPAARAGFATSLLTSALLAKRLGFLPSVIISVMVGVSVEHLYGMAEDIHGKLTADEAKPV